MRTLGLRHVALQVRDVARAAEFYVRVLRMQIEWQPDAQNVYLTSGALDNLALHAADVVADGVQRLDHIGFAVPAADDVDAWHAHVVAHGARVLRPVKTHRDGARSFYFADPEGTAIQVIHHPPIAERAQRYADPGESR